MKLHYSTYRLELKHRFTIARGYEDVVDVVLVYFTKDGVTGVGEAAPNGRYNEDALTIVKHLNSISFNEVSSKDSLDYWLDAALQKANGIRSLETAFDLALHDLYGKLNSTATTDHFDSDPRKACMTSFTIGIDDREKIKEKVLEAKEYPLLKVKLGSDHDKEIINALRDVTDKLIRVDANEGWDLEEGKRMCDWLAERNVEFVEQPLPADNLDDSAKLREHSPLELVADENCIDSEDIPSISDAFDGINIKLMKCGGLREAFKMIQMARERQMKIMLGCMIETSVAITAASILSPLVDYADLDGNILTSNDPFDGVKVKDGMLVLPEGPGLGVKLKE
ncbi:MAG: dipeptide epimerase [Candidatus Marinimicrobia bacterium]|jgi:L-alanine-DL-glutamate epimerase-like enolase superfamily enzyme|nr:dipeptide epimerase [Candidatus Neomarinimicrobiota bacterium]MDP7061265.1 dipeptide epimerase [Candidatus Neomarinimicrobiota bacterium]